MTSQSWIIRSIGFGWFLHGILWDTGWRLGLDVILVVVIGCNLGYHLYHDRRVEA